MLNSAAGRVGLTHNSSTSGGSCAGQGAAQRTRGGRVVAQGAGLAFGVAGVLGAGARRAQDARRLSGARLVLVDLRSGK